MSNGIKIVLQGFKELDDALKQEQENTVKAISKAHIKTASDAERSLKRGLSWRAGKDPSDPTYRNSPKGSLPYMHTGRLRRSIGYKVLTRGKKVSSEVGSGARGAAIEYAQYLQGNDNDGIRPFLDYIEGIYNAETIKQEFLGIFKPLEGGQ